MAIGIGAAMAAVAQHFIAIITSKREHIADARARRLAVGIIDSQRKATPEMKDFINEQEQEEQRM